MPHLPSTYGRKANLKRKICEFKNIWIHVDEALMFHSFPSLLKSILGPTEGPISQSLLAKCK